MTRITAVLLLLSASAAAQASAPKTELVLDNPAVRVYRATIPAHQRLDFQTSGDVLVVRMSTQEAAFLPGSQVFHRPNSKKNNVVDVIVELKQTPGKVNACAEPAKCSRDMMMNGEKVGRAITLFGSNKLSVTRQQVRGGTAINSQNASGDQLLIIPFTQVRVNIAGENKTLEAGEPFFTDANDFQVGGAGAEGKWMAVRLRAAQ